MGPFNSTQSGWYWSVGAEYSQVVKVFSLGTAISLLGLGGNGLVLYFLLCSIKWDRFSVFIFHLALADFAFLTCLLVSVLGWIFRHLHAIALYLRLFSLVSYTAGLCLVVAISVARCLSVFFPVGYRLHSPKHSSTAVCLLSWLLAISLTVLYALFCKYDAAASKLCEQLFTRAYLCLVILLSTSLLCAVILLFTIKCSSSVRPSRKLYIAVALTAVSLLTLSLPALGHFIPKLQILYHCDFVFLFFCVNSSTKPLIYYFAGRMGRQRRWPSLREVFQKAMGK